ncbi:MAG: PBP1A family penicillin-binding protein [Eubacteriales bacterium]|nr:PBP1A family penicillin-binding protein [Eubacteriales bacterium]
MNYGGNGIKQKKKILNSATTKLGTKFGIFVIKLLLVVAIGVVISGSCLVFGAFQGIIESAPDISSINVSPEGFATKIYDNNGNEIQTLATTGTNRIYVTIDQIPKELQHAFVAIEDERFYEHNGIDMKGIMRAAMITLSDGEMSQGASTITQQLLKNNVFNAYNESNIEKIKRKVQEQYLAIKLETVMSKEMILENYLNTINLGNGYYGVQAAANGYFGKDVSELTISECAVLASITKNPTRLNPLRNPEDNRDRQLVVLSNMLEQQYITKEEYTQAVAEDVYSNLQGLEVADGSSSSNYSYFVDELIEQLINDLMEQKGYSKLQATNMIYSGGLQVYSTQDLAMQEAADTIINDPDYYWRNVDFTINYDLTVKETDGKFSYYTQKSMEKWFNEQGNTSFSLTLKDEDKAREYIDTFREAMTSNGGTVTYEKSYFVIQPQISFTVMEVSTGYVKVMVGGRGNKETDRGLNRATNDVTRQPGSSIKPLAVYGPGLDTGSITLASTFDDAPYYYSGTESKLIKNYNEGEYLGYMSVREALRRSQNVPAVKILTKITPQVGFSYLEKFGLTTLVSSKNAINGSHDVVQSLALGGMTRGVCNIDMTAAYAAIANKGTYTKPIYYTQVLDRDGNVILDNNVKETHKVLKESSAWLLTSAMESVVNNGTGRRAKVANQPTAGKTGTTQFDSDIWFCGFTPYYAASIWVGYDDNSRRVSDIINHTAMWGDIMNKIHSGDLPEGSFEKPSDIVEVQVCSQSGKLPVAGLCDSDPRGSCITTEYFSEDNKPTETCDVHVKVKICNVSGSIANVGCTNITTKIMVKKDAAAQVLGNPDDPQYTTADAEFSITADQLTKLCSLHTNKTSSTTGSGSSSSSSSSSGSSSNGTTQSTTSETSSSDDDTSNSNTTATTSSSSSSTNSW